MTILKSLAFVFSKYTNDDVTPLSSVLLTTTLLYPFSLCHQTHKALLTATYINFTTIFSLQKNKECMESRFLEPLISQTSCSLPGSPYWTMQFYFQIFKLNTTQTNICIHWRFKTTGFYCQVFDCIILNVLCCTIISW